MAPKRKNTDGEDLEKSGKVSTKIKKVKSEGEGESEGEAEDSKKSSKSKTVQADYMPKSYQTDVYTDADVTAGNALKIISWNVNGLNACWEKGFSQYVKAENPDILCLQETKLQESKVTPFDAKLLELGFSHRYWNCSTEKKGYSGTAIFSKVKPMSVSFGLGPNSALNEEGRTITAEYEHFYLVNSYVPNSGQKLERLSWRAEVWDTAMLRHLKYLETGDITSEAKAEPAEEGSKSIRGFFQPTSSGASKKSNSASAKPVIFTGDLNVAHAEIDLKNPNSNRNKTAGFCDEERQGMTNFLAAGFEDTYRRLHPDGVAYTYWGMRFNGYASDSGWRIDYFLTSAALRERIKRIVTRKEVYGASDHCPIGLIVSK